MRAECLNDSEKPKQASPGKSFIQELAVIHRVSGDCYGEGLDDLTADDWPVPAGNMIAVFESQRLSAGLSRLSNVF